MAKNKGGRPTKMTDSVIAKLEHAWSIGCSDTQACVYADIVPSTLYRYCETHEEFSERKEALKENPVLKAKQVLYDELENKGDDKIKVAQWIVDKKEGKAKQSVEHSGEIKGESKPIVVNFKSTDEIRDELKKGE